MTWGLGAWGVFPYGASSSSGPVITVTPENGAVEVASNVLVTIDITDTSGVDLLTVMVQIDAIPAFDGSSVGSEFQAPFDGPFSSLSPITDGWRIVIQAPTYSSGVHSVSVVAEDVLAQQSVSNTTFDVSALALITPFNYEPGDAQLRIVPIHNPQIEGLWLFMLGTDVPNQRWPLKLGDKIEVLQAVDVTSINFLRARMELRGPAILPASRKWKVSFNVNLVERAQFDIVAGTSKSIRDVTANVAGLTGNQTISFELELAAA